MKCPHCQQPIDVRLIKAPAMQSQESGNAGSSLGDLLESIDMAAIDGKNYDFVTQVKERFEQYGDRTMMSDKQMAWLRKLAAGVYGRD